MEQMIEASLPIRAGKSEEPMLIKAEDIDVEYHRLENEVIPLGPTEIEVVLAEIPIDELKLDPENPRIQFKLHAMGLPNPSQDELRELLWDMPDVKALKRSIQGNGGLVDAIIVSGKDGKVLEGNCRLTSYKMLRAETDGKDSRWTQIRARILPPGVTRDTIDVLLGELHISGKNHWSPFEQANHLYRLNTEKGFNAALLAEMYRMSKGYVVAKIRAYKLMDKVYVPMAKERGADIKDLSGHWSWFEEFYKKCKPSQPGKELPDRIYDSEKLEEKFCEWVIEDRIPKAADVRKLSEFLDQPKAIKLFEAEGGDVDTGFNFLATIKPALSSRLWKHIETATDMLRQMPHEEIEALRDGDPAKANLFDLLVNAVDKIKAEVRK